MSESLDLWRTLQLATVTLHVQAMLELVTVAMKAAILGYQVVTVVLHWLILY